MPNLCRSGACFACTAKVVEGSVKHDEFTMLDPSMQKQGYVLLCSCEPETDVVVCSQVGRHASCCAAVSWQPCQYTLASHWNHQSSPASDTLASQGSSTRKSPMQTEPEYFFVLLSH